MILEKNIDIYTESVEQLLNRYILLFAQYITGWFKRDKYVTLGVVLIITYFKMSPGIDRLFLQN